MGKTSLYYLFLLAMFSLMSCERTFNISKGRCIGTSRSNSIFEYTIEEHDYINMGYGMAHSGTCKKCKQERDSIVNVLRKELNDN